MARLLRSLPGKARHLGYTIDWRIADAAEFGVPQRRRRLLVIGSRVTSPSLPEPSHAATKRTDARVLSLYETPSPIYGRWPEADRDDPFHRARKHSELTQRRLACIPEGGGRRNLPDELVLDCHRDHEGHYDVYGRMWWDRVAPTLTSGCTNVSRGRFGHPDQDRALTLREAMLLQTFPPHAKLSGFVDNMALQVGNASPASWPSASPRRLSRWMARGSSSAIPPAADAELARQQRTREPRRPDISTRPDPALRSDVPPRRHRR